MATPSDSSTQLAAAMAQLRSVLKTERVLSVQEAKSLGYFSIQQCIASENVCRSTAKQRLDEAVKLGVFETTLVQSESRPAKWYRPVKP